MKASLNKMLLSLESREAFVIGGLILWLALDLGYRLFVSPKYAYEGFTLNFNWVKYAEGLLLYLLLLFSAPRRLICPSDYFLIFLLFGLMAPFFLIYGLNSQSREHLYIVLLGYQLIDWSRRGRRLKLPILKSGWWLAWVFLLGGAMLVSAWLVWSGGTKNLNFDLTKVYEYRRDTGAIINQSAMSYMNTWAYKVLGPALLAVALWKRLYWAAGLALLLHVFWFGVSQHKSVLFYPFLVIFLWLWCHKTRALSAIPLAMSGVVLCVLMLYLWLDLALPASLFIRRVFFVIADNAFYYYDFFSKNMFVYWSNSITSSIVDYPYHIPPAELIGESRGNEAHVNNSFLATGFMHAGIQGVVFYAILVGLLFRLIDSIAAQGVPVWVAVAVLIVPSRSLLLSADLPTALLTHGIAVGVVVLFCLRSLEKKLILGPKKSRPIRRTSIAYRKGSYR